MNTYIISLQQEPSSGIFFCGSSGLQLLWLRPHYGSWCRRWWVRLVLAQRWNGPGVGPVENLVNKSCGKTMMIKWWWMYIIIIITMKYYKYIYQYTYIIGCWSKFFIRQWPFFRNNLLSRNFRELHAYLSRNHVEQQFLSFADSLIFVNHLPNHTKFSRIMCS